MLNSRLGVSNSFIASRIRFGPSPGESASASHASRASSNLTVCA